MREKKNIVLVLSILGFVMLLSGISYAFFSYKSEIVETTLGAGKMSIQINGTSNSINGNATPCNDAIGKMLPDYLDFSVEGLTDTEPIYYEVYIVEQTGTTVDTDYVKVYLTDQNNNEIRGSQYYKYLSPSKRDNGKVLYRETLLPNSDGSEKNTTKNFRLRIWVSEDYNNVSSTSFNFKVYLYAQNEKVNMMSSFPTKITNLKENITEVIFENDTKANIDSSYNAVATNLKADVTYNNIGNVKAWLASDTNNSGKYKLYVKSYGKTYLSTAQGLFDGFTALTTISFGNTDTSMVTDMSNMFHLCLSLASLDVSSFDTSNVTDMSYMFAGHDNSNTLFSHLGTITGLNYFNTSKVTNMEKMFYCAVSLTALDLSNFNTTKVTNMSNMLSGAWNDYQIYMNLASVNGLNNFNTSNVVNMSGMFRMDASITSLDLSSFDTSRVTNMSSMFEHCNSIVILDLSSFNTAGVTNVSNMFSTNNGSLTTIYVSNKWDMSSVNSSSNMFLNSSSIVGGNGTSYDVNYIDATYARIDGQDAYLGYLTDIKVKSVI